MALCQVNFFGNSIGKATAATVMLPEGKGPFPVLYLLHGLSDDHTIWQRRTSLERYLANVPLIVVMPDGLRSWYSNDNRPGGLAMEDFMHKDLVQFIDATFHTIPKRTGRAIAGLSMGGYGATMLAFAHPDVYSAAVSHSGAFFFAHESLKASQPLDEYAAAMGSGARDCYKLARQLKKSGKKVAYRFDCGSADFLIESNRSFHAHLTKLGIAHEYAEHPGEHNWAYWDEHIQQTIPFVMKHVG